MFWNLARWVAEWPHVRIWLRFISNNVLESPTMGHRWPHVRTSLRLISNNVLESRTMDCRVAACANVVEIEF